MCSLCRLPVAKKNNFGQILTFLWAPWLLGSWPPFTDEGKIWCAIADPRYTFTCESSSRSVYSIVLWRRKIPIFAGFFWIQHLVMSPIGSSLRKLKTGAQQKTFPYPTVSKSFLCSNAFMAKSGAQSLPFKSVTNRQTDRQSKQNLKCRPMPNVMVALPNIGGALCSTPQSLANAHY